jgi:hypothetical protein
LPKESFLYPETKPVFDLIEETSRRSGVSRAQAFEDFLHLSLSALSGGQMEQQYMQVVARHTAGERGKRGCDSIAQAFASLISAMEATRKDILGDLFQGSITYGEAGQFLSPEPICEMMARMTIGEADDVDTAGRTICDCCCGSGRMLLAADAVRPGWEFIGQDVDLRCVRMTALNLALRNRYGYVIWGNSLANEKRLIYRTGFNFRGFVREIPLEQCSAPVQQVASESAYAAALSAPPAGSLPPTGNPPPADAIPETPRHQLRLF